MSPAAPAGGQTVPRPSYLSVFSLVRQLYPSSLVSPWVWLKRKLSRGVRLATNHHRFLDDREWSMSGSSSTGFRGTPPSDRQSREPSGPEQSWSTPTRASLWVSAAPGGWSSHARCHTIRG